MSSNPEARRVSAAAIVALIREENAGRRGRGVLGDEEVEERARRRFRDWAERAYVDPRLLDRFLEPEGHSWNIAADYIVRTHRTGPVARLSLVAKRLVGPIVRLYTDHVVKRQTQVNQYLFHLLQHTIRENVRLEARLAALERAAAPRSVDEDAGLSSVAASVARRWRQEAVGADREAP